MVISPFQIFVARAEARAMLWNTGDVDLGDALQPLLDYCSEQNIDKPTAVAVLNAAFQLSLVLVDD